MRAELSHDILKNRIFPSVFKLIKVLEGEVEDSEFVTIFASESLEEIEWLCAELDLLADGAEYALSPSRYFEILPLSGLAEESKDWFSEAIHSNWVEQAQLPARLRRLNESLTGVRKVTSMWRREANSHDLSQVTGHASLLLQELQRLSSEVSDLANLPPYGRAT